ncbi:polysaccharide deacetylase family protein [Persephonella sp.]|uniref:polysaccharide deacetylase family protein n=1 Tax=Persephonella sp. TaxID=2060922 RepID=UPI00263139DF|nr:polysaccharide deacetylase family protein [Persephonella sp.]
MIKFKQKGCKLNSRFLLIILTLTISFCAYAEDFFLYSKYIPYLSKKDPQIVKSFYFKANTNTNKKIIALTFDDGPSENGYTLVPVLKKYKVPATFFWIANRIPKYEINRYNSELFIIGVHTYSHLNYDKLTEKEILNDVEKALDIFHENNLNPKYFRPAYGIVNQGIVKALRKNHLKGILWSIDSMDWKYFENQQIIIQNVVNHLSPGSIILMHETRTKPETLEIIIKEITKQGYKIVPLTEILKYPSKYPNDVN